VIWDAPQWQPYQRFRHLIEAMLDPAFYPIEWLDAQVKAGFYRVFATTRAIIITKIETYPTHARELQGVVAAGDLDQIETVLIPQAEEYGRITGCIRARIESRDGWERVMKKHGYERFQVAIVKDL
jgi:hypothetical protein